MAASIGLFRGVLTWGLLVSGLAAILHLQLWSGQSTLDEATLWPASDPESSPSLVNLFQHGSWLKCPKAANRMAGSTRATVQQGLKEAWAEWAPTLAEPRVSVHVSTDKPIYRPGETVFIRSVLVPLVPSQSTTQEAECQPSWQLEVTGPKKDTVVSSGPSDADRGVVAFQWKIPADLSGGEYTIKVSSPDWQSHNSAGIRKIQIRAFRNPKLRIKIDFLEGGYGPGDHVRAKVEVTRSVGGFPPEGTAVTVMAAVDGAAWLPGPIKAALDALGTCTVEFDLPSHMREGIGSLTAIVDDGGVVESGSKTIPIVLQNINLQLFPEGGPLVEGVSNRVYFEALTPSREPVDLEAELWQVGPQGSTMLSPVKAVHEGRGIFTLIPQPKQSYEVRVLKPAGILRSVLLPAAAKDLVVGNTVHRTLVALSLAHHVTAASRTRQISVKLCGTREGALDVGLFWKEMQLDLVPVTLSKAGEEVVVSLDPGESVATGGVLRVTVLTKSKLPLAERLVFLSPLESLQVEVRADERVPQGSYPGGAQQLQVFVRDSQANPVAGAVLGMVVTDKSTGDLVEERRRAPRLPAMVLLEPEVEHLEDVGAYLGGDPEALLALDLLLGTQGWRRFAYSKPLESLGVGAASPHTAVSSTVTLGGKEAKEEEKAARRESFERMMGLALYGKAPPWGEGRPRRRFQFARGNPEMIMAAAAIPDFRAMQVADDATENVVVLDSVAEEVQEGRAVDIGEAGEGEGAQEAGGAQDREREPEPADAAQVNDIGAAQFVALRKVDARMWKRGVVPTVPPASLITFERVYAHRHKKQADGAITRNDFTETVYWASHLVTDENGVVTVKFNLSDAITSFTVLADAHTLPNSHTSFASFLSFLNKPSAKAFQAFGANTEYLIQSQKPLTVDVKMPLELTAGDKVELPVSVVSAVPVRLNLGVTYTLSGGLQEDSPQGQHEHEHEQPGGQGGTLRNDLRKLQTHLLLSPLQRTRFVLPVKAAASAKPEKSQEPTARATAMQGLPSDEAGDLSSQYTLGAVALEVEGLLLTDVESGSDLVAPGSVHKDAVQRTIKVAVDGFPSQVAFAGVLKPSPEEQEATGQTVLLPSTAVNGSVSMEVVLYCSPLAQLTKALEALVQEPYGCFEQTSATVYPNIMAQHYFKRHGGDQALLDRSLEMLKKGLARLQSFEVKGSGGYEWFGQAPAHEALTAYGLMEFVEMSKVYSVPQSMIERTTAWLMQRKDDPQRTFALNPMHLDGFGGAPQHITLAYITWALTSSGVREGLDGQLASLAEQASTSRDSYFQALVALSLAQAGRLDEATPLLRALQKVQQLDGSIKGATTSITSSWGQSLLVESTALTLLAWLQAGEQAGQWLFEDNSLRAMHWLASQSRGGDFGSTQATVLALKAIMAFDGRRSQEDSRPGTASLLLDGKPVAAVDFDRHSRLPLVIPHPSTAAAWLPGQAHAVQLQLQGGFALPFSVMVRYYDKLPPSSEHCRLRMSTQLDRETVEEGELINIELRLTNQENTPLPMVVAIIGLPGGLEVRHEHLQELVTRGIIPFYEVKGREVVLYWRTISPGAKLVIRLEATAGVPGSFRGPASRAYEYYAKEHKHWVEPLHVVIAAKETQEAAAAIQHA